MPSKKNAFPHERETQKRIPQSEKNAPIHSYFENGVLKTTVTYTDGVKNGLSYLYYKDGKTVQLEMPYVNGKREGVSKKYFENGEVYAETTYHEDQLHVIRKLYNSQGQLKAEIPYGFGFPGVGLVEYLLNWKEKESLKIVVTKRGNELYLSTSAPCQRAKFYIGELIANQFFNELDNNVQLLLEYDQQYFIDLSTHHPSYLQQVDIICSCKSIQRNPLILKQRIDVSSLKNVNQ